MVTIVSKEPNTSITPALYRLLLVGFGFWTRLGTGCPLPLYLLECIPRMLLCGCRCFPSCLAKVSVLGNVIPGALTIVWQQPIVRYCIRSGVELAGNGPWW